MVSGDYTATAKLLHWLIAAFVLALLALGRVMTGIEDLQLRFELYQLHKSMGITVLALMGLRVAWRVLAKPPALPPMMEALERRAAQSTHLALYTLLLFMPLTGWAMVSATPPPFNFPTELYKTIPWPHIPALQQLTLDAKKTVEPLLKTLHAALGWALLALVAIHIAAALRHGLILKDGVMSRMLPRFLYKSRKLIVPLALLSLSAVGAFPAAAQEWAIDKAKSRITFEADAGGQTITGEFQQFEAEIRFDPNYLDIAEIAAAVDVNTVSTGQSQVDAALLGKDWFDAQTYPAVAFRAVSVKRGGGDGAYVMQGNLTIKGSTEPMTLPFTLAVDLGEARVRGEVSINRSNFRIGPTGPVSGLAIGDKVRVKLDIAATRLDN